MKRLIGFIVFCMLFMILGVTETNDMTYLSFLVLPFQFMGDLLRYLSEIGSFGNTVSILLFMVITLLPIGILVYKFLKNKLSTLDFAVFPIMSIALGRTLYLFVNPHILYEALNPIVIDMMPFESIGNLELILTSGVAYIFYLLVSIYLIAHVYIYQKFDAIKYFKVFIDIIIIIYAFAIFSVGLSSLINGLKEAMISEEKTVMILKYIGQILTSGVLIYVLTIFRNFIIEIDRDGFQDSLQIMLKKLSDYSFILLIGTLLIQGIINLYQFMVLDKLMNISFTLDMPIVTILVVSIIFIFSRYVSKVIELKKENELII